jgi:hypothetical protein
MVLAPSRNSPNPGKSAIAKVPVPIFSQPRSERRLCRARALGVRCFGRRCWIGWGRFHWRRIHWRRFGRLCRGRWGSFSIRIGFPDDVPQDQQDQQDDGSATDPDRVHGHRLDRFGFHSARDVRRPAAEGIQRSGPNWSRQGVVPAEPRIHLRKFLHLGGHFGWCCRGCRTFPRCRAGGRSGFLRGCWGSGRRSPLGTAAARAARNVDRLAATRARYSLSREMRGCFEALTTLARHDIRGRDFLNRGSRLLVRGRNRQRISAVGASHSLARQMGLRHELLAARAGNWDTHRAIATFIGVGWETLASNREVSVRNSLAFMLPYEARFGMCRQISRSLLGARPLFHQPSLVGR